MSPVKIGLLLVCGYFMVDGYNLAEPTSKIQVSVLDETSPEAPSQALQDELVAISNIMKGQPEDALVLGRAFKHWAVLIGQNTEVKDLNHFSKGYKKALVTLFTGTEIEGKYQGKLDRVADAAFKRSLSYLFDTSGAITSFEITPRVRGSLVEWSNALSWKFYQVFEENLDATVTE